MEKLKSFLLGLICLLGVIGYGEEVFSETKMSGAVSEEKIIKLEDGTILSIAFFGGAGKQVAVFVPGGVASKEDYYFLAKRPQNE